MSIDSKIEPSTKPTAQDPAKARRTLGVCGFAHFLHDGFTDALTVLGPFWVETFGISLTQVGFLKTASASVMAACQLPAGFLSERFGERGILAVGTILAGSGYIALGFAGGFYGLLAGLILMGIGAATQHPLSSALVSRAYAGGRIRAALGTYNFTGDLGKVAVPFSISLGAGIIGWQSSTIAYGVLAAAGGFAIYVALRLLSFGDRVRVPTRTVETGEPPAGWGIHNKRGFSILSSIAMIDTMTRSGFLPFLPFLLIGKGASPEADIGLAMALVFAGGAAGKFLCGHLAEWFGIIRTVIVTEFVTAAGIIAIVFLPLQAGWILLPIIGVALNGTSSVLYGTVGDFVDENRQSRAFGLFYTLSLGSAATSPIIFGAIGDHAGVPLALTIVGSIALLTVVMCPLLARALPQSAK